MLPIADLPDVPLSRLRASRSEPLRSLCARQPQWAMVVPGQRQPAGDRGVTCYRLLRESFFVQVHWRWSAEQWQEREFEVVPGAVVALRLVLDDADPARITRLLGLPPTRAFQKGDAVLQSRQCRAEGLWIHEVMPEGFHVPEAKVAELLALLRGHAGWREVLRLRGVTWAGVTVHMRGCLERPGGFLFDARTLEDLVGMALQLDLQVAAE